MNVNRRQFLSSNGKALGGLIFVPTFAHGLWKAENRDIAFVNIWNVAVRVGRPFPKWCKSGSVADYPRAGFHQEHYFEASVGDKKHIWCDAHEFGRFNHSIPFYKKNSLAAFGRIPGVVRVVNRAPEPSFHPHVFMQHPVKCAHIRDLNCRGKCDSTCECHP